VYDFLLDFLGLQGLHIDPNIIAVFCGVAFVVVLVAIYDIFIMLFRFVFGGK